MSSAVPASESTPLLADQPDVSTPGVPAALLDATQPVRVVRQWVALLALAIVTLLCCLLMRATMLVLDLSMSDLPWIFHDIFNVIPAVSAVSAVWSISNLTWLRIRSTELPQTINIFGHLMFASGILSGSFSALGALFDNRIIRSLPFAMILFLWIATVVSCVFGVTHLYFFIVSFANWWARVWAFLGSLRLPSLPPPSKPQPRQVTLHVYVHRDGQTDMAGDVAVVRDAIAQVV